LSRFVLPLLLVAALTTHAGAAERGELDASPALFTVLAAINAAGYDADLASPNNHPLRNAVRQALAAKNLASVAELKKFYAAHRQSDPVADLSQYISFALAVEGSPDFSFKGRTVDTPPDVQTLSGLGPLLVEFAREANIEDLWQRSQPAFEQMIARYHQPVSRSILEVNGYLRNVTSGAKGRRFQIYLCLLAGPNQVQTRNYGAHYFVVATPSLEPQVDAIRHAYLFHLLDPLALRSAEVLQRKRGLIDHAMRAQALPEQFKSDFGLLTTASLVKAIEARLTRRPAMVEEALREGYILAPFFAEQLQAYEKQEQSMNFYYADMVKALDLKKEDARLAKVEFLKQAPVRQARMRPPAPEPGLTGAAKTLDEAETMYAARDLGKARETFLHVLQQTEEKPLHAKAYYGLARIAAQQKDPELAERLFQKALELGPAPQDKAWVLVYLGRLSDAAGEPAAAAKHYQSALAVEGASEKARQAAEQGLQQNLKKTEPRP
jgi:tetratricopeptide (TPR) repeat protein